MTILVLGKHGQLARALGRLGAARDLPLQRLGRDEIDFERPHAASDVIEALRPKVVINAAAYTAVDRAEEETSRAWLVNADAPAQAALSARKVGARFIQVSTDYVFSGDKDGPYVEHDRPDPRSVYGESKLCAETLVAQAAPGAIIIRTAWLFDAAGANFVRTMLRLASKSSEVSVVADQRGCPTYVEDLAHSILTMALADGPGGIYHCAGRGEASWAEFAAETFLLSRERGGPAASVRPIGTEEYPTKARRPKNSRLDCSKLQRDYGIEMRCWRQALSSCIDEIAAGGWSLT